MQIPVILAWANIQVKVQRRPITPSTNVLNEPNYGEPSTYPIVPDPYGNTTHSVRIEFDNESVQYLPTGERIVQKQTLMFVDPNDTILPQDRITIMESDINPSPYLPNYFIVETIFPEWDGVGNTNHMLAYLQAV